MTKKRSTHKALQNKKTPYAKKHKAMKRADEREKGDSPSGLAANARRLGVHILVFTLGGLFCGGCLNARR